MSPADDITTALRAHNAAMWAIAGDHAKVSAESPLLYADCVAEGRDMYVDDGLADDLQNAAEWGMDVRGGSR